MTDRADREAPRHPAAVEEITSAFDHAGSTSTPDATSSSDRPLPPLPDGGLAAAMPDWLRSAPDADSIAVGAAPDSDRASGAPADVGASAATIDPTTFLTEDDLPAWIRRLAGGAPPPGETSPPAPPLPPPPAGIGPTRGSQAGPGNPSQAGATIGLSPNPVSTADRPSANLQRLAPPTTAPILAPEPVPFVERTGEKRWVGTAVVLTILLVVVGVLAVLVATGSFP